MHYKNNAARTRVWDKITETLGKPPQDRKKIMVKWKNLKKKFFDLDVPNANKSLSLSGKNQEAFIESMQFYIPFIEEKKLNEYTDSINYDIENEITSQSHEEKATLHKLSPEIWFEDAFIDEIKKHPELFNAGRSSTSKSARKCLWADIGKKFGQPGYIINYL